MVLEHVQQCAQLSGLVLGQVHAEAAGFGQVREQVAQTFEAVVAFGDGVLAQRPGRFGDELVAERLARALVTGIDQIAQACQPGDQLSQHGH